MTRVTLFGVSVLVCLGLCVEMTPRRTVIFGQPEHTHQEEQENPWSAFVGSHIAASGTTATFSAPPLLFKKSSG
jgi:hypothetical protein